MQQSDALEAAALVAKLRARSSSADEQAECCAALSGLRLEGDAAADAIDAIVAALRDGVDLATLQRNCCNVLSQLMQQSADNRVSAAAAGAVEAIVAGLRAHPETLASLACRLKAVRRSCGLLWTVCTLASRRVLLAPSKS
jgi:hypothetical protein